MGRVKYILVDGTHKTTALTLTHKPIHAMILKTDKDIQEVNDLIETGRKGNLRLDHMKRGDLREERGIRKKAEKAGS